MKKIQFKSVTGKITGILLFGLVISIFLFLILYCTSNYMLKQYFANSNFRKNAARQEIEALQEYVNNNHLSATDTTSLRYWAEQRHIVYFTISRKRMLLYDNSYSGDIPLEQTASMQLHYTWQYFQSVQFADGAADVLIYGNYELKYYIITNILIVFISVLFWIMTFIFGVRHEVKYIKELHNEVIKLNTGLENAKFTAKGQDELAYLANALEHLRTTLIEKENNESQMRSAQNKLVLGMAHDLRTPLTSQLAYLEVIKRQNNMYSAYPYIEKVLSKSIEIKNLSDQLFEYFLINSDQLPELEYEQNVEFVLSDYCSELYSMLENEAFTIDTTNLKWEEINIVVCYDYIGRIINNILSNLIKYASKEHSIKIYTQYSTEYFMLIIENHIAHHHDYVSGTGIGVNNIHSMMVQMKGKCEICKTDDIYTTTLYFLSN